MFVWVSVIDFLCSSVCIIDAEDKPFGADLPVEVQNRILWMTRHAEHRDLFTKVHDELKSRRTCGLTDWLRVPKTYKRFHNPCKRNCPCERCDPEPLCHWCILYAKKNISVEFMVLESKLQSLREGFTAYEDEKYRQFVVDNLPAFRDVLLFRDQGYIRPTSQSTPSSQRVLRLRCVVVLHQGEREMGASNRTCGMAFYEPEGYVPDYSPT